MFILILAILSIVLLINLLIILFLLIIFYVFFLIGRNYFISLILNEFIDDHMVFTKIMIQFYWNFFFNLLIFILFYHLSKLKIDNIDHLKK